MPIDGGVLYQLQETVSGRLTDGAAAYRLLRRRHRRRCRRRRRPAGAGRQRRWGRWCVRRFVERVCAEGGVSARRRDDAGSPRRVATTKDGDEGRLDETGLAVAIRRCDAF